MLRDLIRVDRHRCCRIASIIVFALACAGCGPKSPVAPVRGTVLLNDKPLATGAVMTLPKGGRGAQAAINNGEFTLGTFGKAYGALIGTHQVVVVSFEQCQCS